jgi:hypothetical protein
LFSFNLNLGDRDFFIKDILLVDFKYFSFKYLKLLEDIDLAIRLIEFNFILFLGYMNNITKNSSEFDLWWGSKLFKHILLWKDNYVVFY